MKELKALNKRTAPKSVAPEKIIQFGEGNLKPGATISIGKNPKKDELTFKNMIKD